MGKVTHEHVDDRLSAFADALGLHWYRFSENLSGEVKEELLPFIENQDEVDELTENFGLLLDYLGLEIQTGKRIVKKTKKGKK